MELAQSGRPLALRLEQAELDTALASLDAARQRPGVAGIALLQCTCGTGLYLGAGSPLSQALYLGLNGPVAEDDFVRLEEFFLSRQAAVTLSVSPYADVSLLALVGRRPYRLDHFEHTLIRPVGPREAVPETDCAAAVGLAPPEGLPELARTIMRGFCEGLEPEHTGVEAFQFLLASNTISAWQATVDSTVAGGAILSLAGGVALLAGDATLPEFRGRGIQCALIAARLGHASGKGAELAMACTFPGTTSQRNYERLGFRVVYTKALLVLDAGSG